MSTPVCKACEDTHRAPGSGYACNHCPVPCDGCRSGGNGAFCAATPCPCSCHHTASGWSVIEHDPPGPVTLTEKQREEVRAECKRLSEQRDEGVLIPAAGGNLRSLYGQWPGEEGDDEVFNALEATAAGEAGKTFDVGAAQKEAQGLRGKWHGQVFRHYKGGLYHFGDTSVEESTGAILVTYWSDEYKYRWTRTLENFTALVDGVPRFKEDES